MKRIPAIIGACIVTTMTLGINVNAQNLLSDPGFESGTFVPSGVGGWGGFNGAAFSTTVHRTGTMSMFDANVNNVPGSFQFLPAAPGSQWDLTGYGLSTGLPPQSSGPVFGLIQVTFFDGPNGSGNNLGTVLTSPGNAQTSANIDSSSPLNSWIFLDTGVATAPAGAQSIAAYTIFVNFTSLVPTPLGAYFDDLSLTQVPEPSSLAIVGLGLLGIPLRAWTRRK